MSKFATKIVSRQNSVNQYFGIQIHILGVLVGVLVLFGVPGVFLAYRCFGWRTWCLVVWLAYIIYFWRNWCLWYWDVIFVTFRIRDGASYIFLTKKSLNKLS